MTTDAVPTPASGSGRKSDPATEEGVGRSYTEILHRVWSPPPGLYGQLATVQNNAVGGRIIATAFAFFILGGINALLLRSQLAVPENDLIGPDTYNQLFTMHGSTMMYLFAVPILEGIAILVLPFILGNREMPFPRLGAFSFYLFLLGGALFYSSFLFGAVPDAGWFAYTPLSGPEYSPGIAMDFWLLALSVAEIGAISAGVEIIMAIFRMRAPGMSISRMPVLAWSYLVMAFSILFGFTPLIVASLLLELDRKIGTQFFDASAGGSPVLWQHLFWIFGHPEVYIQFIPAAGFISMITPVFSRRPLVGYTFVVVATIATGFMSFGLWVHHMFTVGLPQAAMTFFAAASVMIAIPAGVQVFSWLATIWTGRPVFKTPFLFVIGFLVLFVLGGITGVMVASVPFDWQVHDSYFVVAHFHYVLIGGVTFPLFAALYFWIPKWTGKLLDERLGQINFWTVFIGFNLTFFPMHISGFLGMPRRVYTYEAGFGLTIWNVMSTIGAFILASGILLFVLNYFYSMRRGEPAGADPWNADTLDWATESPAPAHGFTTLPLISTRHPLWQQDELYKGNEQHETVVNALARWPLDWRAALVTSGLDAEPEEVFRVSGPSLAPMFAAIGLVTVFAAEVFSLHIVALIGILIAVVSIIVWHWPEGSPTTEEEVQAFEEETGIPVYIHGSRAISRGGMVLAILLVFIALASFLFAYFYLRLEQGAWPPDGIPRPDLVLPGIATVVLLAAVGVVRWALGRIRQDDRRGLSIGLILAFLLGAAALGTVLYDFLQFDFNWQTNAYGSLVFTIGGYLALIVLSGLLMFIVNLIWTAQGRYSGRSFLSIENTALYWYGTLVAWIIILATLYLTPYLA